MKNSEIVETYETIIFITSSISPIDTFGIIIKFMLYLHAITRNNYRPSNYTGLKGVDWIPLQIVIFSLSIPKKDWRFKKKILLDKTQKNVCLYNGIFTWDYKKHIRVSIITDLEVVVWIPLHLCLYFSIFPKKNAIKFVFECVKHFPAWQTKL